MIMKEGLAESVFWQFQKRGGKANKGKKKPRDELDRALRSSINEATILTPVL